jgi:hypothetical protein
VPGFAIAQLAGGLVAIAVIRTLYPDVTPADAAAVVLPHDASPATADGAGSRSRQLAG